MGQHGCLKQICSYQPHSHAVDERDGNELRVESLSKRLIQAPASDEEDKHADMKRYQRCNDGELECEPVNAEAKEAGHDGRLPFAWVCGLYRIARIECSRRMAFHGPDFSDARL